MERLIVWHRWCPPLDVTPEAVSQATVWRLAAREAFAQLGADPLSELSGTVVFSLPPGDLPRAVELCFALSMSARQVTQQQEPSAGNVSFALTLGQLERVGVSGAWIGDVLDRAQMLASVAGAGDVVLDLSAQSRLMSTHLFAREIQTPTGTPGFVLDSGHPYRERCRESLAYLGRPVLPASSGVQFEALRKLAAAAGRQRVLLVGPRGCGASAWLQQLASELDAPAWLDVRALGTSFAPLSALMYALRRLKGPAQLERVLDAHDDPDQQALRTLLAIRAGQVASRRDAIMALRQFVGRCWERTGKKAVITVNPASLIDPATIGVIAEVARDGGPECFVVMRLYPDTKAPEGFLRAGGLSEVRVPSLAPQDAQRLAASMLEKAPAEVARRAAIMGGNTPLGVAEAVRVLLSSGDVVYRDSGFHWRRGPAGRMTLLGFDALLDERIAPLPVTTLRVLEILACVPEPSDSAVVSDVALVEGVTTALRNMALDELTRLSLIEVTPTDTRISCAVRDAVERAMTEARRAELYLRIATTLAQHDGARGGFARANVAYFLARGGRAKDAVGTLLEVASDAGAAGYVRSGVRLAAAAVECDPSEETQREAARIAQALSESGQLGRSSRVSVPLLTPVGAADTAGHPGQAPARASVSTPAGGHDAQSGDADGAMRPTPDLTSPARAAGALVDDAAGVAVAAIVRGDRDALERALELMVAAGQDGAHIDRLRALFALGRGQLDEAAEQLGRARARASGHGDRARAPRALLGQSLFALARGEASDAVRLALRALSTASAQSDADGCDAALRTLSFCYQTLGRGDDADRLARAAIAPLARAEAQG